MSALLEIQGLTAHYGDFQALFGVDLTLDEGQVLAIIGANGAGKTTLMRAITGIARVSGGTVTLAGARLDRMEAPDILRAGIAMVPEGRRLFYGLTVEENLRLSQRPGGITVEEVWELFPKLKILWKQKAQGLSGGERQMVAVARALMVPSKVILLDEPFEGLAPAVVQDIMDAVVKLRGRASLVIVEHHAESVLPITDRAYIMVNGQIAYEGSAYDLAHDPATQARLLGVAGEH